jgi:hypothetical protein
MLVDGKKELKISIDTNWMADSSLNCITVWSTFIEYLIRGLIVKTFSRTIVNQVYGSFHLLWLKDFKIRPLGEKLS